MPWRGLGINYEGGVLDHPARIAMHLTHRLGASWLPSRCCIASIRWYCANGATPPLALRPCVQVALTLQLLIGIFMVLRGFPLWLATRHNAGAAALLLAVVALNRALRPA